MFAIVKSTGSVASNAVTLARGALVVLALASALAIACNGELDGSLQTPDEGDPAPEATAMPEATATPEARPSPEALTCAAGSSERFQEVSLKAPWPVHCPTFMPDGYQLEEISYGLDILGAVPGVGVGAMEARFTNADTGARVTFVQGLPGLSALTSTIRGQPVLGVIPYGDFQADLFESLPDAPNAPFLAVMGEPSLEVTHWIEAEGLSEDEVRRVAAEMRPVSP